ncbi:hypothetical protein N7G274_007006 [Stereocaulon virgatum]|uniref:Uncharacterized protein n=1 Tax=Stereocaulon virgatum TaxID=373712 RepID=A0ABR4A9R4_9LECA
MRRSSFRLGHTNSFVSMSVILISCNKVNVETRVGTPTKPGFSDNGIMQRLYSMTLGRSELDVGCFYCCGETTLSLSTWREVEMCPNHRSASPSKVGFVHDISIAKVYRLPALLSLNLASRCRKLNVREPKTIIKARGIVFR